MSIKTGSQFVWMKWILLIGLILVCASFAYITWWSFWQTREWFRFLDFAGNEYVSLSMALIFQYGQGPVLFLRGLYTYRQIELEGVLKRRTKGTPEYAAVEHELKTAKYASWGLAAVFVIFGAVDAWTNREQMHAGLDSQRDQGIAITNDKYFFTSVFGVLAIFVEEGLGVAFSLASHTVNDILEIHGRKRIGWLDVFADHARSMLSGGGGGGNKGGGGGSHQGGGGGSYQGGKGGSPAYREGSSSFKGGGNSHRTSFEPTYHTPQVREQADVFKIND